MSKLPPPWHIFIQTVEGRPGPVSMVMADGRPALSPAPIPKDAKPDVGPLVELLRSKEPIPSDVRTWIADLLEEDATTAVRLTLARRKAGKAPNAVGAHWDAAEFVDRLVEGGVKQESALIDAEKRFDVKRSTLMAALTSYRSAREEHAAINREEFAAREDDV